MLSVIQLSRPLTQLFRMLFLNLAHVSGRKSASNPDPLTAICKSLRHNGKNSVFHRAPGYRTTWRVIVLSFIGFPILVSNNQVFKLHPATCLFYPQTCTYKHLDVCFKKLKISLYF